MFKRRVRKRLLILIPLLMLGLIWVLFGFKINLPDEIGVAEARWNTQQIKNYRYRVQFGSMMFIGAVRVTVEDGQVTQVEEGGHPLMPLDASEYTPIAAKPDWYNDIFSRSFPPDLSYYSAEGLFEFAENLPSQSLIAVCSINPTRYEISYNRDYGYIEDLHHTNCATWDVGLGLMCPAVGDCSAGFRITDFEVLPNS